MACGCGKKGVNRTAPAISRIVASKPPTPVEPTENLGWIYQVVDSTKTEILSEWEVAGDAIYEARRVGGRAYRVKRT